MNMTPFDFNGRQVRVIVDEHGEPWFIAMEVAEILGYSDASKMTSRLDDDEKSNRQIGGLGPGTGGRGIITINEPGLFAAVIGSTKPEAKTFKRWVTHDVLPSIRKTGSYSRPMTQAELIAASANQLVAIERQQAAHQVEIERVQGIQADHARLIEDLSHSHVWDHCPQNCLSLTGVKAEMSKRYGISGPVVDFVLKNWMHQPHPAGMVRNGHEDAKGSQYQIWAKTSVTMAFKRFVAGCQMVTPTQAEHPDIQGRFQLRLKGSV